jgi:hypothetical protein
MKASTHNEETVTTRHALYLNLAGLIFATLCVISCDGSHRDGDAATDTDTDTGIDAEGEDDVMDPTE